MARFTPTGNAAELARRIATAVERRADRVIYPRVYALARRFPALARWMLDRFSPRIERPRNAVAFERAPSR